MDDRISIIKLNPKKIIKRYLQAPENSLMMFLKSSADFVGVKQAVRCVIPQSI
jgi:hypothetical protein